MNARLEYRPMVSQETLLEMAQEKVLEDAEMFSEWLSAECMEPAERRTSAYFLPISTAALLTEIMLQKRATDEQLIEGVRELRRRFLEDHQGKVTAEFSRLMAEEEA